MSTQQGGGGNAPAAIFLMGPTGSGKTALALELAQQLPCELISVDSAMVYRGMDIGTAKPTRAQQAVTPHRLIDICDPAEPYSAAQFRRDAQREMGAATHRGRLPVLVGGTMLYFRVLEYGLAPLPAAHPVVRARIAEQARWGGWPALHRRLAFIDPLAAARIHPNDAQRVSRALEVYEVSGRTITELCRHNDAEPLPYNVLTIGLAPHARSVLHERITRRFHAMLAAGLEDEIHALRQRGDLHLGLPSMRAVGYRQVWDCLAGRCTRGEMVEHAIAATRRLARQQLTWLRRERRLTWVDSAGGGASAVISSLISRHVASGGS